MDIHPGWHRLNEALRHHVLTRRRLFPAAAAFAGAMTLGPSLLFGAQRKPDRAHWPSANKIKHVVILCQENRSFDHYFGYFAKHLGEGEHHGEGFVPRDLTYYDASGKGFHPEHLTHYCDDDPDHSWEGSHAKWNGGAMDGWVVAEGGATTAIQYYKPEQHIYHLKLAKAFAIADHNFCAQIGPTLPNRLYLWSGTSGWDYLTPATTTDSLPYNNPSLTAPPPSLTWPTMADLLDAAGLPWKCYSVADGSVPSAIGAFNPLIFFPSILENPAKLARATADIGEFFADLTAGTLPAVSWIVTEATVSEHPPAPPDMGQLLAARIVEEMMASSAWDSSVLFLTYDEGGGYFEHVAPTILENVPATLPDAGQAVGPAFRVPLFIVSPWARAGTVYKPASDHTSILQFIERAFSTKSNPVFLPTIAPARRDLYSLVHAFDFSQTPLMPALPTAKQLIAQANLDVLTLNADRTVADCSTTWPSWLLPLLGA
ncbi:MAG: alkaline phosphatase family protein [Alphaproteobacteria bacterium]|nr:alkaline phosphatase family protein [Alphaproteobacteria bacterium]